MTPTPNLTFKIIFKILWKKWHFWNLKYKSHLPAVNLKILTQAPNLTSNFKTHKNVGGIFLSDVYVGIYLIYIPTKYEENWRTLLITVRPIPPIPSNWSKIKTPHQNSKKLKFYASSPPQNELLRLNSLKNKKKRWLDIKFKILFKILCKNDTYGT